MYNFVMTQLESAFYIFGIISFILNIVLLLGVGFGLILIVRMVLGLKRKVKEKVEVVKNVVKHPEDVLVDVGALVIRKFVKKLKKKISGKRDIDSR